MARFSRISMVLLTGTCLLASTQAQAEERWPRWYLGLGAGVGFVNDSDLSGATTGELHNEAGFSGTVALGYMPFFNTPFLDNFRTEAQFGYQNSKADSFTSGGVGTAVDEELHVYSYMANIYYDLNNSSKWTPYLGAGIGGANVRLPSNPALGTISDSDNVLAYQLMAGLTYAPESIPMTEWGLGYRYFTANSPEFSTAGGTLELDDVTSHNIEATARFRF